MNAIIRTIIKSRVGMGYSPFGHDVTVVTSLLGEVPEEKVVLDYRNLGQVDWFHDRGGKTCHPVMVDGVVKFFYEGEDIFIKEFEDERTVEFTRGWCRENGITFLDRSNSFDPVSGADGYWM
jgi:hypothetical protein